MSLEDQSTTQVIFFDISKAFDRVWHKGLLHKLSAIGIRGQILEWFRNYLAGRTQAVTIKGSSSDFLPVSAGVPQGSVLGPTLFLIYINDIIKSIKSVIKLFADDTSLYLSLKNTIRRTDILNSDMEKITNWATAWKVNFNPLKTELMTISSNRVPSTLPPLRRDRLTRGTFAQALRGNSSTRLQMA